MQLGPHLRLRLLRTVEYTKLPRPRRHVPRFYPGDGAGPLRATLLLRLHSHCGPKGRPEALVPPPCTGETREENFPSRVVIVGDEGTLTRQNIHDVCLLILAPRTWPEVSFGDRLSPNSTWLVSTRHGRRVEVEQHSSTRSIRRARQARLATRPIFSYE